MKKVILLVVTLALVPSFVSAQTWVEQRTDVTADTTTPRLDGWISGKVTGSVGTFAWFQIDQNYGQGYAGLSLTPKSWLQFGVGAGVEQTTRPLRFGSFVWAGNQHVSLLFIGEGLGSGWWYKSEFNWTATKDLGIGLMTERFKGTGPRVQYAVPGTPLTIWSAYLFNEGGNRALMGIRVKM